MNGETHVYHNHTFTCEDGSLIPDKDTFIHTSKYDVSENFSYTKDMCIKKNKL